MMSMRNEFTNFITDVIEKWKMDMYFGFMNNYSFFKDIIPTYNVRDDTSEWLPVSDIG